MKKIYWFILTIGLISCVDQKESELKNVVDSTKTTVVQNPSVVLPKSKYKIWIRTLESNYDGGKNSVRPLNYTLKGKISLYKCFNIATVRDPLTNFNIEQGIYLSIPDPQKDSFIITDPMTKPQLDSLTKVIYKNVEVTQSLKEPLLDSTVLETRYDLADISTPLNKRIKYYGISHRDYLKLSYSEVIRQIKITYINIYQY